MKRLFSALIVIVLCFDFSFAQGDLNLAKFGSISEMKTQIEPFTESFHAGMNVLTFTDASAPSLLGLNVSIFTGFASIEKKPDIGLKDNGYIISTLGLQAGLGTAGFEFYARYFPEFKRSGFGVDALGVGVKYEISDVIPVVGFPSTSLYAEYNSENLSVDDNRTVPVDNGAGGTITGTIKSGIKMKFSTINIGAIVGYDLIVIGVYGKVGVEIGNTNIAWNQAVASNGLVVTQGQSGDISNTAVRYALGLTLFGVRAEVGGRGSNTSFGLGYGISF